MNPEQIRATQLFKDLEAQARELKEEITPEMEAAIIRAIKQGYTIGQEDLKKSAVEMLKKEAGSYSTYGTQLQTKKRVELASVLKIFDIVVTNNKLKTEQ